ncbi:MAG: VOC family protein [Gammaproteobacteria bacterium]|nr:VOC family protein [Gammaproteobacteria bacterium]
MNALTTATPMGPALQFAFVVDDLEAALQFWVQSMGVGPFFHIEQATYRELRYRGQATTPNYSVALAYWGDTQIELITQSCATPSIYREFLDEGRSGQLHHICVSTDDMDRFQREAQARGFEELAHLSMEPSGRVAYFRSHHARWPLTEVGEFPPRILELFDTVRRASVGWDGTAPLRKFQPAPQSGS